MKKLVIFDLSMGNVAYLTKPSFTGYNVSVDRLMTQVRESGLFI
ncbi:MAG: hypothetical protein WAV73_03095 [Candidatus Moraniibacteriota bacterium]